MGAESSAPASDFWLPIGWLNQPERADSVRIVIQGRLWQVYPAELAERLGINYRRDKSGNRLMLELPTQTLTLTVGTPFVTAGNAVLQMPLPVTADRKGLLAPFEPFISQLAAYYSGELLFDPSEPRLLVAATRYNLLGVRYLVVPTETRAVISASEPVDCHADTLGGGTVRLYFPRGTLDTAAFNLTAPQGLIADAEAQADGEGITITYVPEVGAMFAGWEKSDDPPFYTVIYQSQVVSAPDSDALLKLDADRKRWAMDVVVIDPGHGGKDPGAVGKKGLREKEVVLDVGLRLKKALDKRGIKTVITRDRDEFIELHQRTQIANSSGGKLFVSLHCNAARDRKASGSETYFLSPAKTERALSVAELENEAVRYEERRDQYKDLTDENFILLAMAQANFVKESQDLAVEVQQQLPDGVGTKDRGVDQAGFYVLVGASMPAVLCEMGFISNLDEEKKLRDKGFRQKIADEIGEAVVGFLKQTQGDGQ